MTSSLQITRHGRECLDDLEPLWKALQRTHIEVGAELGKTRTEEEAWRLRRADYNEWLDDPATFVLLATLDDRPVGYALVRGYRRSCSFVTGEDTVELKTLSVLPEYRSRGIGAALMEDLFARCRAMGVTQMAIGVVATNERAVKFYERFGFQCRYVTMWGELPG